MPLKSHKIIVFHSLKEIPRDSWNALCPPDFPFSDHAFLLALESSGSVGEEPGWIPLYITLWEEKTLKGAIYLYQKNNSYGEYIFDWEWVRAYHANQVPYYPKLVSAVPFTPATGPKLLLHPSADKRSSSKILLQTCLELMGQTQSQSLHFLFIEEEEIELFTSMGLMARHSFQYHWKNRGYSQFSDFIDHLKTKKGTQILRERTQLNKQNISIERITGSQLTNDHADLMYRFYLSTTEKMGAIPYLTLDFFKTIFSEFSNHVLFHLAKKEGKPIAGSLSYWKGKKLFGRYWGSLEEVRNLHFELCYYQLIDFAIENKIELFEAGAQGEHKIQRGFLPEFTYSAHTVVHPVFRSAIGDFVQKEKEAIEDLRTEMLQHSPFKSKVS